MSGMAQAGFIALAATLSCQSAGPARTGPGAKPEQLASPLVLRDGQRGVVGETGTVITIEPDGSFRVAAFLNDRIEPPRRTGRLSEAALRALARRLAADLDEPLPATLGGRVGSNPQRIQLSYGKASSTMLLPAGSDPGAAVTPMPEGGGATARFVRIWTTARALVAEAPADR